MQQGKARLQVALLQTLQHPKGAQQNAACSNRTLPSPTALQHPTPTPQETSLDSTHSSKVMGMMPPLCKPSGLPLRRQGSEVVERDQFPLVGEKHHGLTVQEEQPWCAQKADTCTCTQMESLHVAGTRQVCTGRITQPAFVISAWAKPARRRLLSWACLGADRKICKEKQSDLLMHSCLLFFHSTD